MPSSRPLTRINPSTIDSLFPLVIVRTSPPRNNATTVVVVVAVAVAATVAVAVALGVVAVLAVVALVVHS